jgi:hypothetical protein
LAAAAGWDAFAARASGRRAIAGAGGWLVAVTIAYAAGWIENGHGSSLERVPWVAYCVLPLMALGLVLPARRGEPDAAFARRLGLVAAAPILGTLATMPPRLGPLEPDDAYVARSIAEVTTFRGLADVKRCLPGIRQLYHSEVGVPGVVFPDARVVDLAGLMSERIASSRSRFDDYCLEDRPEVIFLPHKSYVVRNLEIAGSRCIRGYERMTRKSSSPLFVRADLAEPFRRCATELGRWQ